MSKVITVSFASAIVLMLSFLAVSPALAATVSNVEFSNGDVTTQGNAGQSIAGKVRVVVGVNEETEFMEFDVLSDNLGPVCVDVSRLQEGTHWVNIPGDLKFPPNTGTYSMQVKTAGIYGGLSAIDCTNNVNGTQNFGSAIRTVGGSSSSSVGGSSLYQQLLDMIAALKTQIEEIKNPVKPSYCASLPASSMKGSTGQWAVQSMLISNGFSIPAGATGYWGSQTDAAYFAAKAHCN